MIFSYFIFYLIWFNALEKNITVHFTPVRHLFDSYIPFNEWFLIPYLLWFLYIFVTIMYFFFTSKTEFYQICTYLFAGMTICLIVYTLWPNGHYLRPNIDSLGRSNILTKGVKLLYQTDTSTNVCPSIHVFNSIGAYIAIAKNEKLSSNYYIKYSALILTILICMSTCFLKQHSIIDVFWAMLLNLIMYLVVYVLMNQRQSDNHTVSPYM